MYVKTPASFIYHLVLGHGLTVCQKHIVGARTPARRYDDWKVVSEKPSGQFDTLCKECEMRSSPDYVKPEPVPLSRDCLRDTIPA